MGIEFWFKTSGTWINVATVLAGTLVGLLLGGRLPKRMQVVITQGLGLLTIFIGISMAGSLGQASAGKLDGVIVGLIAMVGGGLMGEALRLEDGLNRVGDWLKYRFKGKGRFTEGFVASSILFCIGPMTLIGSMNNGLSGDNTLLTLKASMDGLAAIALTSIYGIGVGFSALFILVYQSSISLIAGALAQSLPDPSTAPAVLLLTGVGGLIVLGTGFNLLDLTKIRLASFLPSLLLTPILYWLGEWLT